MDARPAESAKRMLAEEAVGVPLTNCNIMGQTCSSKVLEYSKTVNAHALANMSTSESLLPKMRRGFK